MELRNIFRRRRRRNKLPLHTYIYNEDSDINWDR
jgi:hypothetical protein